MPPKGASPAEIKAWVAECKAQATPEERAEYEATGENLKAVFKRIGYDPTSGTFAPRERRIEIEVAPHDQ
jgi:hypothetical protein